MRRRQRRRGLRERDDTSEGVYGFVRGHTLTENLLRPALHAADKLKALIVDGQNNHQVWPKSTIMMKQYLEDTGRFVVEIRRSRFTWQS